MFFNFQLSGEEFPERITLVNGQRTNDSPRIRDGLETFSLA